MRYCCCKTLENLCVCLLNILTDSKGLKKTSAVEEDTESIESDESIDSIENEKSIESIERYEQKGKVSETVNVHSENSLVLNACETTDSYKRLVKSLVVTIYNRKIVRCLIANANLAFVLRRV